MQVAWRQGNCILISVVYPSFHLLQRVFTSHIYPRKGNKTKLTSRMAKILFCVGTCTWTYLPSLICCQIHNFKHCGVRSTYPFASLMTVIATSQFNLKPPKGEVRTIGQFTIGNVRKMALMPRPHHQGCWPPSVAPHLDEHVAGEDEAEAAPHAPEAEAEQPPQDKVQDEPSHPFQSQILSIS